MSLLNNQQAAEVTLTYLHPNDLIEVGYSKIYKPPRYLLRSIASFCESAALSYKKRAAVNPLIQNNLQKLQRKLD